MAGGRSGETKDRLGVRLVNIFVTSTRNQEASSSCDNDVLCKQRTPLKSRAAIKCEIVACAIGEKDEFGCGRIYGANVINVHEASQFRRDLGVQTVADDKDAWIDEVRLAFRFARAEIDYQTVALLKIHRRTAKIETLVREKTERPADEKRPVKHSVEPGRVRVSRIVIAATVKDREFVALPILVDGKL